MKLSQFLGAFKNWNPGNYFRDSAFSNIASCVLLFYSIAGYAENVEIGDSCVFRLPYPPVGITRVADRAEYVASHYWQGLDYSDKSWLSDTLALEQIFVDWIPVLAQLPPDSRAKAAATVILYGKDYPDMQLRLCELAELYFCGRNSPYRNEEIYIPIVQALINDSGIDTVRKVYYRHQLERILKNRPDTLAADIAFSTAKRRRGHLYGLLSDYVLLYFFNPDCGMCRQATEYIKKSQVLSSLSAERRLTILAVYPGDDLRLWKSNLKATPEDWTVARYAGKTDRTAYDLSSIPEFYLLDAKKTVILKDASIEEVEAWLQAEVN